MAVEATGLGWGGGVAMVLADEHGHNDDDNMGEGKKETRRALAKP